MKAVAERLADRALSALVPSERALALLWQRAHTLSQGLVTQEGRRLRVVYPGRANSRAGPDFHDAVIATEAGHLIYGDIELHVNAPDWYGHGPNADPNYNGVILHVVLWPRGAVSSHQQSGIKAPVASIAHVAPSLECAGTSAEGEVLPQLKAMDGQALGDALDRAGDERFLARSRGYALELAECEPDQVLYGALMEALGYVSNRRPFRELAGRVPIASLASMKGEPAATRLLAFKALLIGTAGLLPYASPPEEALQMGRLLKRLPRTKRMSAGQWHLFRVRPANRPVARIYGAAHLVDRHVEVGLVPGLAAVGDADARTLVNRLVVPPFIGRGRAGDMAVNVLLPFLHAFSGFARSPALSRRAIQLYRSFPKLGDNEITREMRRLLGVRSGAEEVASARRQQGLIQHYRSLVRPSLGGRDLTG